MQFPGKLIPSVQYTMMETLRFAGDDDDLYSFDTVHPALDTRHLESDHGFKEAVRTSYGRRPPVG